MGINMFDEIDDFHTNAMYNKDREFIAAKAALRAANTAAKSSDVAYKAAKKAGDYATAAGHLAEYRALRAPALRTLDELSPYARFLGGRDMLVLLKHARKAWEAPWGVGTKANPGGPRVVEKLYQGQVKRLSNGDRSVNDSYAALYDGFALVVIESGKGTGLRDAQAGEWNLIYVPTPAQTSYLQLEVDAAKRHRYLDQLRETARAQYDAFVANGRKHVASTPMLSVPPSPGSRATDAAPLAATVSEPVVRPVVDYDAAEPPAFGGERPSGSGIDWYALEAQGEDPGYTLSPDDELDAA